MRKAVPLVAVAAMALLAAPASAGDEPATALPELRVADNDRFLVTADGAPFFWLGDTAWELYHRTTRAEAVTYLDNRAALGFNVVQAVALSELDGLGTPNSHGDTPFVDGDLTKPAVTEGADPADDEQYDYWDHVDYVVSSAAERGIYTAMLPAWGRWVVDDGVLDEGNAQAYGEFLGARYKESRIVWVLGGDRPADGVEDVWRALARGIAIGASGTEDYSTVLMTYHPRGDEGSSSKPFHDEPWLDFNMQQNGHCRDDEAWLPIAADYDLQPTKPVLDGEPLYESHPGFCDSQTDHSTDYDVRKLAWWEVFAGAFGHTYGNHAIWQMWTPDRDPVTDPLRPWYEALDEPGGAQMRHLRSLVESRPFLDRIPDQALLASDPGGDGEHVQATRGADGGYAFVYSAVGNPFSVTMSALSGTEVLAHWYDPRTGEATAIGRFPTEGTQEFTPPARGQDWTLVLDDAARGFPPPGADGA
jgi:uncharacterized protein DUF4038/collagenase-like protein with putative collagen-binding domain